jgi:NDP-sugar pyrophosphorylase family protein
MRGIILAAGKGSRLNGTAGDKPKCLVEAGGLTLIERQVQILERAGVDEIVVVVGCGADRVRSQCGRRVTYIENTRYAETNSLYSLWMARALLYEGFVVLNCDVVFHPVLLNDLLTSRHQDALLIAYREAHQPPFSDEEMKVKVRCGRVADMSKTMEHFARGPRARSVSSPGCVLFTPSARAGCPGSRLIFPRTTSAPSTKSFPRSTRWWATWRIARATDTSAPAICAWLPTPDEIFDVAAR